MTAGELLRWQRDGYPRYHRSRGNLLIHAAGPANALARIVLEQWVTFPRFVLSGAWSRARTEGAR